jgi:hypothetical protein
MPDFMVCRTAELGGHADQGAQCGCERDAYNACRNRHGPQCPTLPKAKWRAARKADLLAGPYCHGVLPLPPDLNPLGLTNTRALLSVRLQATSQTLRQCGPHNLGGPLDGRLLFHPWTQTLTAHCHGHALVPGGALAAEGPRWVPTPPRCVCPLEALGPGFRAKCLETLCHRRKARVFAEQPPPRASAKDCQRFLARLYDQAGGVDAKRAMAGPGQGRDYLGRSPHRVALATHRIVEVHDAQVRCR